MPHLLRNKAIFCLNQVWSINITYIKLHRSPMYLTAIIDWYSRKIRSACCSRPWRECGGVGMQKRPPRVAGQYNRPNAFRQGNLLTQTAGGCIPQALWLRYSQSQNSFAIDFQKWS